MSRFLRGTFSAMTLTLVSATLMSGCAAAENFATGAKPGSVAAAGASTPAPLDATVQAAPVPVTVDQSTPESAMETWLTAMMAGDEEAVCGVMASDGKPLAKIPGAAKTCAATVKDRLDTVSGLAGLLEGPLSITDATVVKGHATFEGTTTVPEEAGQIISRFRAIKVADKWYVCT